MKRRQRSAPTAGRRTPPALTLPLFALVAVTLVAIALAAPAGASPQPPAAGSAPVDAYPVDPYPVDAYPVDQVQRGQRGYGYTVLAGSEPVRFEMEVLGVLRNQSPSSDAVLVRLSGHGLEETGVASGMSGSPVFLDDRLLGAVAFTWAFSTGAVAGITPIEAMRLLGGDGGVQVGGVQVGGVQVGRAAAGPPPVALAAIAARALPENLLADELSRLLPRRSDSAVSAVQWSAAGFGADTMALLSGTLGATGTLGVTGMGGSAAPADGPHRLVAGGPVAAVVVDGDLRLAAAGTVTEVVGEKVLAFGHQFLGSGPMSIPMAEAEVVTTVGSRQSSFKVTNVGRVVGAIVDDRRAGLAGTIGAAARTFPVTVEVADGQGDAAHYEMRVADLPAFTPSMVGTCALGSLEVAARRSGLLGLDLTARFRIAGHPDLTIDQTFDGASAATDSAGYLLAIAAFLVQNQLEEVHLEGVEIAYRLHREPRTVTLLGAHAEHSAVRPGDDVTLQLDLKRFRGETFRRTVRLTLPEELPAGRYSLLVGDGASIDTARLQVVKAEPETFSQALEQIASLQSQRRLAILGVHPGKGLAVAGRSMPRLPGSVRALWGTAGAGSSTPLTLAIAQSWQEELPYPLEGIQRIDLEVRRKRPVGPGGGDTTGGDATGGDGTGGDGTGGDGISGGGDGTSGAGGGGESGEATETGGAGGGEETDRGPGPRSGG